MVLCYEQSVLTNPPKPRVVQKSAASGPGSGLVRYGSVPVAHVWSSVSHQAGVTCSSRRACPAASWLCPSRLTETAQGADGSRTGILAKCLPGSLPPTLTVSYRFAFMGKYVLSSQGLLTSAVLDRSLFKLRTALCTFLTNIQREYTFC